MRFLLSVAGFLVSDLLFSNPSTFSSAEKLMAPLSDPASANCWVTQNRRPATVEDQDKRWKRKIITRHSWLISVFNFLQRLAVRTGRSSFSPLCLFSFPQLFIFRMKNMPARTSQANQSKARGGGGGGEKGHNSLRWEHEGRAPAGSGQPFSFPAPRPLARAGLRVRLAPLAPRQAAASGAPRAPSHRRRRSGGCRPVAPLAGPGAASERLA